jgi:SsrA-binding protein
MSEPVTTKELASNKKAFFNYEILETFEVGIVLVGTEIKSLRNHGGSLQDAYIQIEKKELWLIGSSIAPYKFGNIHNHEERRKRKLLAHKKEISRIQASIQEKGLTCVPLSMYLKNGRVKLKIGLAKGKKLHDKRETIKEREDQRTIQKMLKSS